MESSAILPFALANAISGFATLFAGLTALALSLLIRRPPKHWMAVYAAIAVTGIPTIWYHGFGEQFWPGVADVGTNLLLGWLALFAVLTDLYANKTRTWVSLLAGLLALAAVGQKIVAHYTAESVFVLRFGSFGVFYIAELSLALIALLTAGLIFARRKDFPPPSRPLLRAVMAIFVVAISLATVGNQAIVLRIIAFHALWHLVGAFGFMFLWAFNYVRFSGEPRVTGR